MGTTNLSFVAQTISLRTIVMLFLIKQSSTPTVHEGLVQPMLAHLGHP